MDVTPIKTEADFRTALAEIERLWDAKPDTPEGDRLDILMTLVEVYERRHHPMPPADPIAAIEFMMEQRGNGPIGWAQVARRPFAKKG